jgi:glycosyltransferase involved in cell wall biosynthesis
MIDRKIINWYGTLAQGQGYSGSSEKIAIALDKYFDVRVMSFTEYVRSNLTEEGKKLRDKPFIMADTGIICGFPNAFNTVMNKNKIGITMFETDKLPRGGSSNDWAGMSGNPEEPINKMDTLIVPCQHNKSLFAREGVTIPIEVVPFGVDTKQFEKYERPKRDTFTFLMLGTLTIRKNPGMVLSAFLELFKDRPDVRLVLKTSSGTLGHIQMPYDNIKIIDRYSTVDELKCIYRDADAFVFPSRGEGFGLPPLEAMATGLPTIIADNTGMSDYADERYNYPIPVAEKKKAIRFPKKWGNVGNWYEPDYDALKDAMREVESNRNESYKKGLLAADWVRENFTFDKTAEKIRDIVLKIDNK